MMPFARLPNGIMQNLQLVNKTGGGYGTNGVANTPAEGVPTSFKGAILPLGMNETDFDEGGTYVKDTSKLLTYTVLQDGQQILDMNEIRYSILEDKPYNPYAGGLSIYYIKKVGATTI